MESNIATLVKQYRESKIAEGVGSHVAELHAKPGEKYEASQDQPNWLYQTTVLTWRTLLNNTRNITVFWMR